MSHSFEELTVNQVTWTRQLKNNSTADNPHQATASHKQTQSPHTSHAHTHTHTPISVCKLISVEVIHPWDVTMDTRGWRDVLMCISCPKDCTVTWQRLQSSTMTLWSNSLLHCHYTCSEMSHVSNVWQIIQRTGKLLSDKWQFIEISNTPHLSACALLTPNNFYPSFELFMIIWWHLLTVQIWQTIWDAFIFSI